MKMVIFKKRRLIVIWLLFMAMVIPSQAQKADEEEEVEEEKKVTGLQFTAIELGRLPFEKIYYRKGKKLVLLELEQMSRSDPYALDSSSQHLELYTDNKDAEDAENKYKLIGKTHLLQL